MEVLTRLSCEHSLCVSISVKIGPDGIDSVTSAGLCFVSSGGFASYYVVQTEQQRLRARGFQTDWSFRWLEVVHPPLSGQTAVTGERRPGQTGKTLLSHFQMLGVTLACLAHRADNELLFSQRRCLVLTADLTALALIGLRNEQDFPALFCFNCCSS